MSILALWLKRGASGLSLLQRATSQLGGIAPYHFWDFINNRALFASADVGAVTSTPGWSYTGTHSLGGLRYADKADGTLEAFGTNICLQSQTFDNASWTNNANVTLTAAAAVAPDGTTTAYSMAGSSAASNVKRIGQNGGSAAVHTYSIFAKANTHSFIQIYIGADVTQFADFNLATGAVGTVGGGTTASIRALANGWYRCTITVTLAGSSSPYVQLVDSATASWAASSTTTNSVYLWGAQLEAGTTATTYIPTTTAANGALRRTDKGVLIEGARTNLLLRSATLNTTWSLGSNSAADNSVTSPTGDLTGSTVTMVSGSSVFQSVAVTESTTYTFSFWAKRGTKTAAQYRVYNNTGAANITSATSYYSLINASTWVRVVHTFATPAGCVSIRVYIDDSSDGSSGTFFFFGAQLEAASFPSSYVPTTSASATRNADVLTVSSPGVTYPLSLYAQYSMPVVTSASALAVQIDANSNNERAYISWSSGNIPTVGAIAGAVAQADIIVGSAQTADQTITIAGRIATNDAQGARGATLGTPDTSVTLPSTPTHIRFGMHVSGAHGFVYLRRCAVVNSAVNDAGLQSMTL